VHLTENRQSTESPRKVDYFRLTQKLWRAYAVAAIPPRAIAGTATVNYATRSTEFDGHIKRQKAK
jgi:hypothetical protein